VPDEGKSFSCKRCGKAVVRTRSPYEQIVEVVLKDGPGRNAELQAILTEVCSTEVEQLRSELEGVRKLVDLGRESKEGVVRELHSMQKAYQKSQGDLAQAKKSLQLSEAALTSMSAWCVQKHYEAPLPGMSHEFEGGSNHQFKLPSALVPKPVLQLTPMTPRALERKGVLDQRSKDLEVLQRILSQAVFTPPTVVEYFVEERGYSNPPKEYQSMKKYVQSLWGKLLRLGSIVPCVGGYRAK
jgi:hypothetical protein